MGTVADGAALLARLRYAYRIVEEGEWAAAQAASMYGGSAMDAKDGFMHLSLASEVLTTANLYYAAHAGPLLVLKVSLGKLVGAQLRCDWVGTRGAFFPHILRGEAGNGIPCAAVESVHQLRKGVDGKWTGFNEVE